jgi:tellurite resistance protein TehA-like permease
VWWLTSLLFVAFSCALLARTLCYPRAMVLMLHHPTMSLFLGTIPMSFSTLINGIVAIWVPR